MSLLHAIQKLPLGVQYSLGRTLSLLMRVAHYRKKVVVGNLSAAFPQWSKKELRKNRKKFYSNFGRVYAEALWLGGCRGKKEKFFAKRLFTIEGQEDLYAAFDKGGVMILDSHCGNWELTGAFLQGTVDAPGANFTEADVAVVYRRLHSPKWDKAMRDIRCALQSKDFEGYIESQDIMRYALRHKDSKKIYLFPNDQYPYGASKSRENITFMNRETKAMDGAVVLASKLKLSVFYMNKDRLPDGKYKVSYSKICDDASAHQPEEIIKDYYTRLEADIRKNPSNYLWSHKRWK